MTPTISLLDLQGSALKRILEFLTVPELCRAEQWCQTIRTYDIPFVWTATAERVIPAEASGGPSVTLPAKDRVRRWTVASAFAKRAEQSWEWAYHPTGYMPTVENISSRIWHCDYFVRLSSFAHRTQHSRSSTSCCSCCQGFVPLTFDVEGLFNLSLTPIVQSQPEAQPLLEALQLAQSDQTYQDQADPDRRRRLNELGQSLFHAAWCSLTVVQVSRDGSCQTVLVTSLRDGMGMTTIDNGQRQRQQPGTFVYKMETLPRRVSLREPDGVTCSRFKAIVQVRASNQGQRIDLRIVSSL